MKLPFFSLVMPAYNCESTIGNTIDSILQQTVQDFELIIIDDGSTDNTYKVIEEYTQSDNRIKSKKSENKGPGNARNIGIELSQGEYIVFIDSDDVLENENLAKRANFLEKHDIDLLVGSYETEVMDGQDVVDVRNTIASDKIYTSNTDFLNDLYELMDQQLMYVIWNKVYKREIIHAHNIRFPSYKSCEDRLFNLAYFKYVRNCVVTSEVLYHYSFDGKNSLTNKYFDNKFMTFEEFYLKSIELVPEDTPGFSALFLKGTMSCFIPLHSKSCPLNFVEKNQYIKDVLSNPNVNYAKKISTSTGLIKMIFKVLFYIPSVHLHYFVSYLLYHLGTLSPKKIEKLKQTF